jgi:hypothetical protein
VAAARDPANGLSAAVRAGLSYPRWLDRAATGVPATAASVAAMAADAAVAASGTLPSGGSAGVPWSWTAGDCCCLISHQENKAILILEIGECAH